MKDGEAPRPFDERVVLDELERLRQSIADQRSRRRELGDEFDRFVRSMHQARGTVAPPSSPPTGVTPGVPEAAGSSASSAGQRPAGAPAAGHTPVVPAVPARRKGRGDPGAILDFLPETPKAQAAARPPAVQQKVPVAPAERPVRAPEPSQRPYQPAPAATPVQTPRKSSVPMIAIAIGLIAVLALAWNVFKAPAESTPSDEPAAAAVPAAAPPPAAAAPAPAVTGSELTTTRRVWVRVIADGERIVERELAADSKVPIPAKKTIVVRTGDAGAVRLVVGGKDLGALGRNGEVITRTFDLPGGGR